MTRTLAIFGAMVCCATVLALAPAASAQAAATCDGRTATLVGTAGNDTLRGTSGKDIIAGLGGDDLIYGLGGGDIICGGPGRDRIFGQAGKDKIIGSGSADRLYGGPGDDIIDGGGGSDRIFGGRGNDTITGGTGFDRLKGDPGTDTCNTDTFDVFFVECEAGNSKRFAGVGDRLIRPRLDNSFAVAEHCFDFVRTCDKFYVARVKIDGSTSFDAMSITAFNIAGDSIATYGDAGDRFSGVFMFNEKPQRIEVDSGGGSYEILFVQKSGIRVGAARTSGVGNQVYVVKRAPTGLVTADADWTGFGHFAVVAVSPSKGRDILINEVRFQGNGNPPFSAQVVAPPSISLVQVLSDSGNWTVELAS